MAHAKGFVIKESEMEIKKLLKTAIPFIFAFVGMPFQATNKYVQITVS